MNSKNEPFITQEKPSAATPHLVPPTVSTPYNKYIRRHKLNSRGKGIVYNGIEKTSGKEVALKDFRDKRTGSKISTEIEILCHLAHDHIIRYIDLVRDPEPLLVMEFVGGGNLADLQNVSQHEILLMARQTSQAVSYLHGHNITHRGIKPATYSLSHCKWRAEDKADLRIIKLRAEAQF